MRARTSRLPQLIVAALTLGSGHSVAVAQDGSVGVHDNVVRVAARATVPGREGVVVPDRSDCHWQLVIEDDSLPMYDPDGTGLYSDTGRWFQWMCDGDPVPVGDLIAVPEGGGFSIPDLTEQALDALNPADPAWSASPNGTTVAMVTQMPTFLWVDGSYWNAAHAVRVETPSGRVWAEARGRPTSASFDTGDAAPTVCPGGGRAWTPALSANPAACTHTFRRSTVGTPGRPLAVTVEFAVEGRTSVNPTPVPAGTISRTSTPVLVQIVEIQALASNGR